MSELLPRSVNILGSTGSIGTNTLDVIRAHRDKYQVKLLVAYQNAALLAQQALEFGATDVIIVDSAQYRNCCDRLSGTNIRVHTGIEALLSLASEPVDITIAAIVGVAGLRATLAAMQSSKVVAIANKESIICGGHLLKQAAIKSNTTLLPIDSEHCAILQVMAGEELSKVTRITLTASGGPCRQMTRSEMVDITPDFATQHPTWKMGPKISVDCATLFNKGLEVIEAYYFFPIQYGNVEVVIHPQSVVHSVVTYCDGSSLAQLSLPDMRVPISYVLGYPKRISITHRHLDLSVLGRLDFDIPDFERFPLLKLVMEVAQADPSIQIAMNAANEVAVNLFLQGKIGFLDIERIVQDSVQKHNIVPVNSVEEVYMLHDIIYQHKLAA